jgi:LacI family transcriptional regulator
LPRLIEKGEVDGVIILSGIAEQLRLLCRLGLPVVKLGSTFSDCHSVSAAHEEGVRLATEHLIALGHRRIAFIGHEVKIAPCESTLVEAAQKRLRGFRTAMKKAALPAQWIDSTLRESFPDYGARAFESLWEKSRGEITAVVCYNDTLAMGVLQAAQKLGLKVPRDLSVVGFDNVSQDYHFEPCLASVHFDRHQMGVRAVEILMQAREASNSAPAHIQEKLPVAFVAGATTAPPPA